MLSTHTGAPVLAGRCVPRPHGRHCLVLEPLVWPEGRGTEAEAALTRSYLGIVESWIHERPELWLWMHRRFKLTFRHTSARAIARNRKESGLPADEPIDAGPFPEGVADELRELTRTGFLEGSGDALILGGPGSGRSRIARSAGHRLLERGHTVHHATAEALAGELLAAGEKGTLARLYRRMDGFELLIVEDLDAAPPSASATSALAELLEQRRGRRATLISAGAAGDELIRRLDGPPQAIDSLRRWLDRARPIRLSG
jgi:DNA replication protein DnaC